MACAATNTEESTSGPTMQLNGRSPGFIVNLDTTWEKFQVLADGKEDETKRAARLLTIKEELLHALIQMTTQPVMSYDELERAVIVPSTYLASDWERYDEVSHCN